MEPNPSLARMELLITSYLLSLLVELLSVKMLVFVSAALLTVIGSASGEFRLISLFSHVETCDLSIIKDADFKYTSNRVYCC